ncbi:MAG: zinc-dependent alcohol dehydrogenase [Blautia sp.]
MRDDWGIPYKMGMKQAVLTAPETFEIREVEKPVPQKGEALLKVKAVGICGSDIHAYYGKHPFMSCPIVLGHEATGEVVELGEGVDRVAIGDRVIMRPQDVCGECHMCKEGRYNICKSLKVLGCQETGASSDYYAVNADLLYKIPESLPYDVATVVEPLAVGVHAVKRPVGGVKGKNVVVIGAGTIGNVVAQSAKGLGAKKVMITDVSEFKLEMAKKCGVDITVNVAKEDIFKVIEENYGVDGVDVVFECSANDGALNQALEYARKGTTIVIVGVFGNKATVNMANVQDREYVLMGTLMYEHEDYVDALRLAGDGTVNLEALITQRFPLEKVADAYTCIKENKEGVQKVILTV